MQAKALYEKYINTKEKQSVVKTVCEAVEQIYKDLDGEAKKQKALENISVILFSVCIIKSKMTFKQFMRLEKQF